MSAQLFIHDELDAICDDDYAEEVRDIYDQIEETIRLVDSELQ